MRTAVSILSNAVAAALLAAPGAALGQAGEPGPGPDTLFVQEASWSPDGRELSLSVMKRNVYRVFRIGADGEGSTPLTDGKQSSYWTSWSPDGKRIAFATRMDGSSEIQVVNRDGTGLVRLTQDDYRDSAPDWSPDGERIAFSSNRDGTQLIYVMNADGSGAMPVSSGQGVEHASPDWAPDGERIVYYASDGGGNDTIQVVSADGTGTAALGPGTWPRWSPDGARILFTRDHVVRVMNADGSEPEEVTRGFYADWAPDGERIAVVRNTWRAPSGWPATSAVFLVRLADGEETRLTWP